MKSKKALITGASRGIGQAIAVDLALAGMEVILTYLQNKEMVENVVETIRSKGGKAHYHKLDAGCSADCHALFSKISEQHNHIDVLVNNAGIAQEKPFETITEGDWEKMFSVNLKGPFLLSQEFVKGMAQRGFGRIINIVSIGGQWGGFNQVHYAVAKAGLISLTQSMAKIYSAKGVTINAVSPGLVNTSMVDNELHTAEGIKKVAAIPIGRIASAEEIAKVVTFLSSENASYITGQTINANGGMYFG